MENGPRKGFDLSTGLSFRTECLQHLIEELRMQILTSLMSPFGSNYVFFINSFIHILGLFTVLIKLVLFGCQLFCLRLFVCFPVVFFPPAFATQLQKQKKIEESSTLDQKCQKLVGICTELATDCLGGKK